MPRQILPPAPLRYSFLYLPASAKTSQLSSSSGDDEVSHRLTRG
jgi:hypothetical protein